MTTVNELKEKTDSKIEEFLDRLMSENLLVKNSRVDGGSFAGIFFRMWKIVFSSANKIINRNSASWSQGCFISSLILEGVFLYAFYNHQIIQINYCKKPLSYEQIF